MFKNLKKSTIFSTGLGLNVARRIVESHDGKISVNSAIGYGTQVTLSLPLVGE